MIEIKVFNDNYGWQKTMTFSPEEIAALQLSGRTDDDIAAMNPIPEKLANISANELESARNKLCEFWKTDNEDGLINLVRECDAQYWVECSAGVASEFKKIGAVPLPNTMVKNLLYGHKPFIPAQDGIRFMRQGADLPDRSAWRTIFLLSSIKQYDAVCESLSPLIDYNIVTREDAVGAFVALYDQTGDPSIYEQFPIWKETIRKARYILKDSKKKGRLTEYESMLLYRYFKYYLKGYEELSLHDLPTKYLYTKEDKDGVVYSLSGKRLIGVTDRKSFNSTNYVIADGVESLDEGAFMCISCLKHIKLPESLRRIGSKQFLQSGLEELTIPASVDFPIGRCMCEGCKSLKTVKFKNHQERLDIALFNGASSLESVNMPAGVVNVLDLCFADTSSLKTIDLTGVRFIGDDCFLNSGAQLKLPETVEIVGLTAFKGMSKDSVYLDNYPNPYNYTLDTKYAHHTFAEFFTEGPMWINGLAGLYGLVRYLQDLELREHTIEGRKIELSLYIKWLHDHLAEGCVFDKEMIEFCAFTMDPVSFSSLWFACIIAVKIEEEDLFFKEYEFLKYGIEFKNLLPEIYSIFDGRGSHRAIDDFIESISKDETVIHDRKAQSKCLNDADPTLLDEFEFALSNTHDDLCKVRMKSQYGYAHTTGPTMTTSKELITKLRDIMTV